MGTIGRILVTGASGFLGREIVAVARRHAVEVTVLVRSDHQVSAGWQGDAGIIQQQLDLASPDAETGLAVALQDVNTVIHAAAALSGTDKDHARDTVGATETLIRAMLARKVTDGRVPRLVLISSLSVYGYAALPDRATLDERTPVEPDPLLRDAYCRAKLAQESLALQAAQADGLAVRVLRVGALYGPGRTWSARLGIRAAGWVICPGGSALVPAIHVAHCAESVLRATQRPPGPDDVPILHGGGAFDIINLVDHDPPTQRDWLRAIGCSRVIRIPWGPMARLARVLDLIGALLPVIGRRLPSSLREATLAARFKPLFYSTARAEDRLTHAAGQPFHEAMRGSQASTTTSGETP